MISLTDIINVLDKFRRLSVRTELVSAGHKSRSIDINANSSTVLKFESWMDENQF